MTNTYTPIASVTLSATASEVVFSGLPQTFRDLIVVIGQPSAAAVATIGLRFNGDTGNNYSYVDMTGNGSGTSSSANTQDRATLGFVGDTAAYNSIANIMDYAQTNKHKTVLARHSNPSGNVQALANRWANTSAVTSLAVLTAVNVFPIGSTFTVFGVIA